MVSGSAQSHPPQAVWPWIVMPAVVLLVFCILHFDVRPLGNPGTLAAPSSLSAASSIPEE